VLDRVEPMDPILVDGSNGICFIRPGDEVRSAFNASMQMFEAKRAAYRAAKDLPSVTKDGVDITLMMNAGLLIDMGHLHESGAAGIGLYRTEVPFMIRSDFPDTATQAELYGKILDQAEGKPVTFRTLDIGGDKVLPYFQEAVEENPAMGWRAIRIAIDRPGLMRGQLRALIMACKGRPLRIMFPMIANADEFVQARAMLDRELGRASQRGVILPSEVKVGADAVDALEHGAGVGVQLRAFDFDVVDSNEQHLVVEFHHIEKVGALRIAKELLEFKDFLGSEPDKRIRQGLS